jgi:site-specific recombinase XerD
VKFYFEQVLGRGKIYFGEIPRPKKNASLPKVFSKTDIAKLFAQLDNLKHQLMLKLCYGMGLRVSENK